MKKLAGLPPEVAAEIKKKYHLDEPSAPLPSVVLRPDAPQRPVDALPIVPFEGIGPLKLGMTPEEMADAVSRLCAGWAGPGGGVEIRSDIARGMAETAFRYIGEGCHAVFQAGYRDGRAVDITVYRNARDYASVALDGLEVFDREVIPLVAELKGRSALTCDTGDEEMSYWYWFRDLGFCLGREGLFDPKRVEDILREAREEDGADEELIRLRIEGERQYLYFNSACVAEKDMAFFPERLAVQVSA